MVVPTATDERESVELWIHQVRSQLAASFAIPATVIVMPSLDFAMILVAVQRMHAGVQVPMHFENVDFRCRRIRQTTRKVYFSAFCPNARKKRNRPAKLSPDPDLPDTK